MLPNRKEFLIALLQPVCYLSCHVIPVTLIVLLYNRPYQPPFLGSILHRNHGYVARFAILFLEFVTFTQVVLSGSFYILYVVFAGICSILKYSGAVFSSRPACRKEANILAYRTLHVATSHVNDCIRHTLLPVCIIGPPILQMLGSFACIKLRTEIDWPLFAVFPVIVLISFILTVMPLLAAGRIYVTSWRFMNQWRSNYFGRESRYFRRVGKSMKPLRIHFGKNFVDACTPLVVQDFCMRQIAGLLMYYNSYEM